MLISYKRGQGSIVLRVKLLNSSVATGAGLAGLTSASSGLIISTIADNEATATAYTVAGSLIESITTLGTYAAPTATKVRFKEVDATNHKGVYEIQIADARFAVSSAKSLIVSLSGATNLAETDVTVPLLDINPYDAVRAGLTALPSAVPGAAGGVFIAGTNAATTITGTNASGATPATPALTLAGGAASTTGGGVAAPALAATGGAGAASTNGAAIGAKIAGGGTNTVASGAHGLQVLGTSTGSGLDAESGAGATGNGATFLANSTNGHGVKSTGVGTGDGMELTAGASGADLDADRVGTLTGGITGNVTGNLSGSVGSVTTVSDKTGYALTVAYDPAKTASQAGDVMKVSTGTGANQLDVTSGVVKSNMVQLLATAFTESGAGRLVAGIKKFFDVATPLSTMEALTLVATTTTVTSRVTANADQIAGDATSATNLKTSFNDTAGPVPWLGIVDQGTAQAATGTTLQFRAGATFADDTILGAVVAALGSTQGYWQTQQITDYVGSTDTATVPGWVVTPSGTITYKVFSVPQGVAISSADLALIAAAVADLALSGHTTTGTAGAAWSAASSAGDPWSTALPGGYGAGTAGKILSDAAASIATLITRITGTVALASKVKRYFQLALRKDAAIATDAATELGEINENVASGVGAYTSTTDAQEALRDRGDAAWTPPSASTVATAVAAQVTTDHGSGSYIRNTEPLDAAATRAALGMATNNLDTQLDALPTAVENADAYLARNAKGGSTGPANQSVAAAIAGGFMEFAISGSTLTVKYADGTTAYTRTLTRAQLDAIVASA